MLEANVPSRHLSFVREASFFAFAAIHFLFGGIFGKFCGHCFDTGQNDTIGKIELNPSFVLSSDNTNYKNDIQ